VQALLFNHPADGKFDRQVNNHTRSRLILFWGRSTLHALVLFVCE
jgi:hypothetical protein